ncbi:hypothetical protein O7623_21085 [Solwaraspora sp. WMMD791]|uniref:hypothetical protein n=1 Tax=Solwaraspora sp. WMMD791 TaxID=3016086 RepID=UPI00249B2E15|nr:hypothetical protein [Solwaraspora sp. WMMD791]WFE25848.1 hypothetical protein O7623_21085 [Solwaraspora sp. WMMD791]
MVRRHSYFRRRGAPPPVVLLAALSVAGCFGCTPSPPVSVAETDPTLLVHDVQGGGDDAQIDGYLRHLADADCFVLEPDVTTGPDGMRNVAVWPPGTKVWRDGGQVTGVDVPGREPIAIGSRVVGDGGYANPSTSDLDLPEVTPECLTGGGEFAMLHTIVSVTP